MSYIDVFGNVTTPPSEFGFQALSISTNTVTEWPYNSSGGVAVSKIMDVTATVAGLSIALPSATEVSVGEDVLIRNVGSEDFDVLDAASGVVTTVTSGSAKYIYLTDNTTVAGVYGVVAFGVGTSTVDAASLIGYGVIAIGSSLNQAHPVVEQSGTFNIGSAERASLVNYIGGSVTATLTSAVTLGDNFFVLLRNSGTGLLTLDPNGSETVDGQSAFDLQPGESLMLFCSGAAWYTVGYGRSLIYNFTQLVYDVSAAGAFTLSTTEASNKLLTFIGNPSGAVTVTVPSTVAVYYILSDISTAQTITIKTSTGVGVDIGQGVRAILICDGSEVYSAQSAVVSTNIALIDGGVSTPSLAFASQTNTGLYKQGSYGIGVAVNGVAKSKFDTDGVTDYGLTVDGAIKVVLLGAVTGTDSITATAHASVAAYSAGQEFRFVTVGANTGAVTLNINGIGVKNVYKSGSQPLDAGDLASGQVVSVVYDGTQFQLISGAGGGGGATGGGSDEIFVQNGQTVTTNYTIPAGKNAHSVGAITIADGVTVTISDGSRWVVS